VEAHKEAVRDEFRLRLVEDAFADARYAVRTLRRNPTFCTVAVLTIGIGVGATTSIFSIVDGVLLRSLPWPGAERLVVPRSVELKSGDQWSTAYADYLDWKAEGVFESASVFQAREMNLAGPETAERVEAAIVSTDFFGTLGLRPVLGRDFRADESEPDAPRVVVVSHQLWSRQLGADAFVLGRTLRIGGVPREVVGVLPPGKAFPFDAHAWVPLSIDPADRPDYERRDNFVFGSIARLKADRTLAETRAHLAALASRVAGDEPRTRAGVSVTAVPLLDFVVGDDLPRALWLFMAAVVLVLLIGCFNLANLLLGRAATRRREFAIRGAIGAGRGRLVRQLLAESLVLALAGGLVGVVLAAAGVRVLVALAPQDVPRLDGVSLDAAALGFALAACVISAFVFGLAPAAALASGRLAGALGDGDWRSTVGKRGRRARNLLASAEVALSLMLLVGAGLLLSSLRHLGNVDPGFDRKGVLTFALSLQGERYDDRVVRTETYRALLERTQAVPGVDQASIASALPLGGGGFYLGRSFLAEGEPDPPAGRELSGMWTAVGPGYFRTLRLPVLQGREFTASDTAESTPVMIVNQEFARRMFPAGGALGRRVQSSRDEKVLREIVGVTNDVRYFGAADKAQPLVYVPHSQDSYRSMVLVVRTAADAAAVTPAIRGLVREIDAGLALGQVRTMDEAFATSVASHRFGATLLTVFSAVALLLASIGLYGVISYAVAQRSREFGIRLALGARRRDISGLVLREGIALAVAGAAVGLVGALLASRTMAALLYGIQPTDHPTYGAVLALILGVATLASWLPAHRASRTDPMQVIRAE
jgi:predicted permease